MPTNEERREVAAKLRSITNYEYSSMFIDEIIGACIGGDLYDDEYQLLDCKIVNRLADLIEPEERTCRMTKKGPEFVMAGWWECSECGPVYPPCNDEIAKWALQRCPRCGAKVVE